MATAVDAAIAEIEAALTAINPQLEGMRDFGRLNIHPDTMIVIQDSIDQYTRRVSLLGAVELALQALITDGYPTLAVKEIPDQAFTDLQENASTIEAALAQFSSGKATILKTSAGAPEPK